MCIYSAVSVAATGHGVKYVNGKHCTPFTFDASLVGDKTIQRLRNNEEYPTTVQTVLGLCYGLKLTVPEAEMLISKTDFHIKPTIPQNYAYRCALSACTENSIYEINEMLELKTLTA